MPESQTIEYKSNWRDDYMKWICGFADANGGKLYIGVGDDGQVSGIERPCAKRVHPKTNWENLG